MQTEEIILSIVFIIVMIFAFIEVIWIIFNILDESIDKKYAKKAEMSLNNIFKTYQNTDDYDQCEYELNILMKEIVARNESLKRRYDNVVKMLQKYMADINSGIVKIDSGNIDELKKKLKSFIEDYERKNQFEMLTSIEDRIFQELRESITSDDEEASLEIIKQLAIEFKEKREYIYEVEKNKKAQDVATKISIGITVVFGIMTFIQFFV